MHIKNFNLRGGPDYVKSIKHCTNFLSEKKLTVLLFATLQSITKPLFTDANVNVLSLADTVWSFATFFNQSMISVFFALVTSYTFCCVFIT